MSRPVNNNDKLSLMRGLMSSRATWLETFSSGRSKRPDHELFQRKIELVIMKSIAADYEKLVNSGRGEE